MDAMALQQALRNAAIETFETMAFVETIPVQGAERESGRYAHRLCIDVDEPESMSVFLLYDDALKTLASRNVYPGGSTPHEAEQTDCVKEMFNVICGQFLSELYGSGVRFAMSVPKKASMHDGEHEIVAVDFAAEEQFFTLAVCSSVKNARAAV